MGKRLDKENTAYSSTLLENSNSSGKNFMKNHYLMWFLFARENEATYPSIFLNSEHFANIYEVCSA